MEEQIAIYLGGSTVLATFLMLWLKKYIKEFIEPRFGDLGVLGTLLAIAVILSMVGYFWGQLPSDITGAVGTIFSTSLVIYQLLIKAVLNKAILNKLDSDEK